MIVLRKAYVDYIKAIGIILVIIGHINFANSNLGIKGWIYSFHMPLFFFSSGLVMKRAVVDRTFLSKKVKTLLLPFVLWGLIYSELTIKNIAYIVYGSYDTLKRANSLTSLWFLPAMFFGIVAAQFVITILNKSYLQVLSICILGMVGITIPKYELGYPWCIDVSLLAAAFILLGFLVDQLLYNKSKIVMFIFFAVGAAGTMMFRFNVVQENGYVLMARRYVGNPFLFFVVSICGCLMIYGISKLLDNGKLENKFLEFVGSNTLAIFATHKPLIKICEEIFIHISLPWFVELVCTTVTVLVISCFLVVLINRFIPILNGKNK